MKRNPGWLVRQLAALCGSQVRDEETGEFLGRAFLVPWRGRVHLVGYTGVVPLRPTVQARRAVTYWKVSVGFCCASRPDFPRQR